MAEKSKRGRPRVDSEAITLRLPRAMIDAIDDARRMEKDLPTRPEMIRRVLAQRFGMTGEAEQKKFN